MKLKCQRCDKEWDYKGEIVANEKYTQYTSCPRCKTSVKIEIKETTNKIKNGNTNREEI